VPDKRLHRGPHPEDWRLFAPEAWPRLRDAVRDLSWLLSRGYADPSALKLVGDRYQLTERQRTAVARASCSDQALRRRTEHRAELQAGQTLLLDGYNVLTTIEAALAGGVVLHARDGCFRDMASVHGTYRKVQETRPALQLLGERLAQFGFGLCRWYLDSPVSNSGRLKGVLLETAAAHGWNWTVELVHNPDAVLAEAPELVATADSMILDRCARWINLAREVVVSRIPAAQVIDLSLADSPLSCAAAAAASQAAT
jgi:hypothetical protein